MEPNESIRCNAMWALKNLVYQSDTQLKQQVLAMLTPSRLRRCLTEDCVIMKIQSWNLLRNAACSSHQDIQLLFDLFTEDGLYRLLTDVLVNGGGGSGASGSSQDVLVVEQALFCLVNILTGSGEHKDSLLKAGNNQILRVIGERYFASENNCLRKASIWCIMNMTWKDCPMHEQRTCKLRDEFGMQALLEHMLTVEVDFNILDIIKTALSNFLLPLQDQ